MAERGRLTSAEAAAALGVKPATLYAYVSRGLLSRERTSRGSTFDAGEVTRLASSARRAHRGAEATELAFATSVTLITDGHLLYRGHEATDLAANHPFEAVADWVWGLGLGEPAPWVVDDRRSASASATAASLDPSVAPIDRIKVAVVAAGSVDPLRADLAPAAVTAAGRDLVAMAVGCLPPVGRRRRTPSEGVAERLWGRLSPLPARADRVRTLDAALSLLADHELAASTLAARVAAAFGADPYAVVGTGLGALSGHLHGAASNQVVRLLEDMERDGPAVAVGERLARRELLPGFGMPLYPDGDPRARDLLARLDTGLGEPTRRGTVRALVDLAAERGIPAPNVDLALGALAYETAMVPGAGTAIMALARTVGWLAHAMEEYAAQTTFRARATYVGDRSGVTG